MIHSVSSDIVQTKLCLEINGEEQVVPAVSSVRELLQHLDVGEEGVAIEVNRRILRRTEWEKTSLHERDKVEIVRFVGGG